MRKKNTAIIRKVPDKKRERDENALKQCEISADLVQ